MPSAATKELGLPCVTVVLSECAKGPQVYLLRNSDEDSILYPDILTRDHENPSPRPPKQPVLYSAGFPCRPFSYMTTETELLNDDRAKPFFEVKRTIKAQQPLLVILENA